MKFQVLTISVVIDHNLFTNFEEHENSKFKNHLVYDLIGQLLNRQQTLIYKKNTYVIYSKFRLTEDIIMFKLGKRVKTDLHIEENNDIILSKTSDTPFIMGFISLKRQAILVGCNKNVISNNKVVEVLEEGLNQYKQADDLNYNFKLTTLKETTHFWGVIDKNKNQIKEIQLDFFPPNFGGFGKSVRDSLTHVKNETNNTKLSVSYKNEHGNLIVKEEFFGDMVKYVRASGEWKIAIKRNGRTTIYKSNDKTSFVTVEESVVKFFDKYRGNNEITNNEKDKFFSEIEEIMSTVYEKESN
ncbi:MAG: hypothetical protein RBQ97_07870 [Acholeplasma sp.]|nr:hypothetical protein [Acholeplasma sp.]